MGRTVTRAELLAEGRSWIKTPILWQQSRKGVGCDCKGLIAGVARELGIEEALSLAAIRRDYGRSFNPQMLLDGLDATLIRTEEPGVGDVLAIAAGAPRAPRHLAMLSDRPGWVIHAYGRGHDYVVEAPLGGWRFVYGHWTWPSLAREEQL